MELESRFLYLLGRLESRHFFTKPYILVMGKRGKKPSWTDEDLRTAVSQSVNYAMVCRLLGLNGEDKKNKRRIKAAVARLGLDTTHFTNRGDPAHWRAKQETYFREIGRPDFIARMNEPRPVRPPKTPVDERVARWIYIDYQRGAQERGYVFELDFKEFWDIVRQDCIYCGAPPLLKNRYGRYRSAMNGVDRFDNSHGYIPENCVPCCSRCNWEKKSIGLPLVRRIAQVDAERRLTAAHVEALEAVEANEALTQ